ncbi:SOS response-associated peptidase [Bacillus sp. 2205SS5-2]|uniref:SOS response-associated peptidase n=1 Tax=Bacillus sp. 2205SS5-2 TaxID=3109031 RepID=UPI003003ADA6
MCGRYTNLANPEDLQTLIQIDEWTVEWEPSYNVAPGQRVLSAIGHNGKIKAGYLHWGLLPQWKSSGTAQKLMINARSETVTEKKSFQALFQQKRCVMFADSFFEWKREGSERIPYRFQLNEDRPFAFAGLWDIRKIAGEKKPMGTILTTQANELVQPVHDRMPVMLLSEESIHCWLDTSLEYDEVKLLFTPISSEEMVSYQVSNRVNSSKNNDPTCIQSF